MRFTSGAPAGIACLPCRRQFPFARRSQARFFKRVLGATPLRENYPPESFRSLTRVSNNRAGAFTVPGRAASNLHGSAAQIQSSNREQKGSAKQSAPRHSLGGRSVWCSCGDSEPVRRKTTLSFLLGRSGALRLFGAPRRKVRVQIANNIKSAPRPRGAERGFGAPAEIRTPDPLIKSQMLYQLSYRGVSHLCIISQRSRFVKVF